MLFCECSYLVVEGGCGVVDGGVDLVNEFDYGFGCVWNVGEIY